MSQILRSDHFRDTLKEIGAFIARESGSRQIATDFLRRIHKKCLAYARQPEMAEMRPELGEGIRSFPVGSYVVFYRLTQQEIFLLTIIHGSRDIPTVFRRIIDSENLS